MKEDYTHLSVILDRSGSMSSIRDDTIGGFNAFLHDQQAQAGTATLTLVQFDTQDAYEVIHHFRPIGEVPPLTRDTFVPRGGTPLLDAMGRGLNDLESCLAKLAPADRPAKVVLVVVTDGQENSSREFTKATVAGMIKEKTEQQDWQFVFLSADLAAIGEARDLGLDPDKMLLHQKDARGTAASYESLSQRTSDYRAGRKRKIGFEASDREHPEDPNRK